MLEIGSLHSNIGKLKGLLGTKLYFNVGWVSFSPLHFVENFGIISKVVVPARWLVRTKSRGDAHMNAASCLVETKISRDYNAFPRGVSKRHTGQSGVGGNHVCAREYPRRTRRL